MAAAIIKSVSLTKDDWGKLDKLVDFFKAKSPNPKDVNRSWVIRKLMDDAESKYLNP